MPLVAPVLVGFMVILAAMVVMGMHHTSVLWLRPLLNGLAHPRGGFLRRAAFAPLRLLAHGVLKIEHYVLVPLSHWASAHVGVLAHWFTGLRAAWHGLISEVEAIPDDVADALGHLRHALIPHLIHAALAPVLRLAHAAHWIGTHANAYAHAEAKRIWRGIDQLEHRLTARFVKLYHGIDAFVHHTVWPRVRAAERDLAGVITRDLPRIRAEEKSLSRRLTNLERALAVGVIGALLVRALARVAPWLFCRNWKRIGPRVCGLDPLLIEDAFGLLLAVETLTNLEEVVRILQGVVQETTEAIQELAEV